VVFKDKSDLWSLRKMPKQGTESQIALCATAKTTPQGDDPRLQKFGWLDPRAFRCNSPENAEQCGDGILSNNQQLDE
jgi:hypothetical protein